MASLAVHVLQKFHKTGGKNMSMFLFGDIICSRNTSFFEVCKAAKKIYAFNSDSINIKFGGNVSNQYFSLISSDSLKVPYEITDSIMENTADMLLAPRTYEGIPTWAIRMGYIEKFTHSVFMFTEVEILTMSINMEQNMNIAKYTYTCKLEELKDILNGIFEEAHPFIYPVAQIMIER